MTKVILARRIIRCRRRDVFDLSLEFVESFNRISVCSSLPQWVLSQVKYDHSALIATGPEFDKALAYCQLMEIAGRISKLTGVKNYFFHRTLLDHQGQLLRSKYQEYKKQIERYFQDEWPTYASHSTIPLLCLKFRHYYFKALMGSGAELRLERITQKQFERHLTNEVHVEDYVSILGQQLRFISVKSTSEDESFVAALDKRDDILMLFINWRQELPDFTP